MEKQYEKPTIEIIVFEDEIETANRSVITCLNLIFKKHDYNCR